MYIPKEFRQEDRREIIAFIETYSFASLICEHAGKLIATHLPLTVKEDTMDNIMLYGHVSKGNEQWSQFDSETDFLVIFQGPHTYVSSGWYSHEKVPTWNYQSVHLYGKARSLDTEELKASLKELISIHEASHEQLVDYDHLDSKLIEREIRGIIGFEIKVNSIEAAYKLSQNRNQTDYQNIIYKLGQQSSPNAQSVANEMRRISSSDDSQS